MTPRSESTEVADERDQTTKAKIGMESEEGRNASKVCQTLLGCASACRERFFGKYSMSTELCFGSRYIGWLAGS